MACCSVLNQALCNSGKNKWERQNVRKEVKKSRQIGSYFRKQENKTWKHKLQKRRRSKRRQLFDVEPLHIMDNIMEYSDYSIIQKNVTMNDNNNCIEYKTFSTLTFAHYLDPILSDYDHLLQIAIQKSFDSLPNNNGKTATKSNNAFKKMMESLPKCAQTITYLNSTKKKRVQVPNKNDGNETLESVKVKVDINMHSSHGIYDYQNMNGQNLLTKIDHVPVFGAYDKRPCAYAPDSEIYSVLPYQLTNCSLNICINGKIFSSLVHSNNDKIIPIFIKKQNKTSRSHSVCSDNIRLIQIAQKCLECVSNASVIWRFDNMHIRNDGSFAPIVCRMRDILSEYIPIYDDIIDGVLIPYIGHSQLDTISLSATSKNPLAKETQDWFCNEPSHGMGHEINLGSAPTNDFKYISRSSTQSFVPKLTKYPFGPIEYTKDTELKEHDFTKRQKGKVCIPEEYWRWMRRLTTVTYFDDNCDERQIAKELKYKKSGGGRRKRRSRGYIVKEDFKHRRRYEKKKHRKNVRHSNKHKKIKSRLAKGYRRRWRGSKDKTFQSIKGNFKIVHIPSYAYKNEQSLNWDVSCNDWAGGFNASGSPEHRRWYRYHPWEPSGESSRYYHRNRKTNKRFLSKSGRKNKRSF